MRRFVPVTALVLLIAVGIAPFAFSATTAKSAAKSSDHSPGAPIASAISTVTGMAISPLLGTSAYGAYQWFTAPDEAARAKLPWFAQMKFWLPALLLVGLCAAKDTFAAVVPTGMKKPLDVLEAIENKISGLVAAGAVIPFIMMALSKVVGGTTSAAAGNVTTTGLAMLPLGLVDSSWALNILTLPLGITVFAVVWMASHAINALILLSPWGAIDAVLKAARTSLLGVLTFTSMIDPWVGAGLSLVTIVFAFYISGWAFRLTVFGSAFCWDFLTVRRNRFSPRENDNAMFSGGTLPGVPPRTFGRLVLRTAGNFEFVFRPWLWRPVRVVPVPATKTSLGIARGIFFSRIMRDAKSTLFVLPPRYCGHEDVVQRAYFMGGGVYDAGLRKVWSGLKELIAGTAAPVRVT
jgi:hypothetical protein